MARSNHGRARLHVEADGSVSLTLDVKALAARIAAAEGGGAAGQRRAARKAKRFAKRLRRMAEHGDGRRAARLARQAVEGGA